MILKIFFCVISLTLPGLSLIYPGSSSGNVVIPTAGNSWVISSFPEKSDAINNKGISNWTNSSDIIRTWFKTERTGDAEIYIRAKVLSGSSEIEASMNGKSKKITLKNVTFDTIYIGSFTIKEAGYNYLEMKGIKKSGNTFAEIPEIILKGDVTKGAVSLVKDDFYFGRRGPSVHLRYLLPGNVTQIEYFYNEITIPEGNDVQGSYFMANGFSDGYKSGTWHELTEVKFTADATARKRSRLDYSGGAEGNAFYLRNCGFFNDITEVDQTFSRVATGVAPSVKFDDLE